ncbi:acetyl-CoA carboxylase carboxyl transferase subunit alpha [Hathewaya proteolytica DSM 3090]|uniref:Acetyl-coenzyme A carboxylase carboxyl transferase subunit alpha n=1 Tax=Hathewaya proteolytica DSM 3090 TaxID=1121331 RepID=A0A1M6M279_9CLOT|nr:acetyl-CoA carboxylase carboxyltransferase subunit alpha [Hathewaya proteolytica]SHJ77541.1 acetyl-CoA carboxylase carboxyl transferase subunit alpha [Hathewaya proteolytica DSM 3090]
MCNVSPFERVKLARNPERPNIMAYIDNLFNDFFPLDGDRLCADDKSILCGIAFYHGIPVTVIGHRKGKDLEENIKYNFGMPNPEGYRKARRIMEEAERFGRPIITFIDTPGAYPGIEAEARGQGEAIAQCLATMSGLKVPIISVVIGEGGSGGALALGVADTMIMLENSIFSVLSPEGFASILWKDSSKSKEACSLMKLTAQDLYQYNIADYIVPEPDGGIQVNPINVYEKLDEVIYGEIKKLRNIDRNKLVQRRYKKLRSMGNALERNVNERN